MCLTHDNRQVFRAPDYTGIKLCYKKKWIRGIAVLILTPGILKCHGQPQIVKLLARIVDFQPGLKSMVKFFERNPKCQSNSVLHREELPIRGVLIRAKELPYFFLSIRIHN